MASLAFGIPSISTKRRDTPFRYALANLNSDRQNAVYESHPNGARQRLLTGRRHFKHQEVGERGTNVPRSPKLR